MIDTQATRRMTEETYDLCVLEIGVRGDMRRDRFPEWARAYGLLRKQHPDAKIAFSLGGYDDDPRELWVIPEARSFLLAFGAYLNALHPGLPGVYGETIDLLRACAVPLDLVDEVVCVTPDAPFTS